MAGMLSYTREAVRVKVKKCESNQPIELRKFSVDPQITSLEVLYSILAKAFELKSDFSISYKTVDPSGQDVFLPVLSDWDLDAAFLRAHNASVANNTESCLNLKVDIKPFSEANEWDASGTAQNFISQREQSPLQQSIGVGQKYVQTMQTRLPGLIMNQMEKTISMVTRALNLVEDQSILLHPPRQPLSDQEFRTFLDSVGQIVNPQQLRLVIYAGGIDPSLRRVVWKHILNVYPGDMTGRERMDYMKRKAEEYNKLKDTWRKAIQNGCTAGELAYVTSMVRKDVLRTDRLHPFYAGSDDNKNIAALFNILTTYALNHPAVSYCQGMSDLASPLLVTMDSEPQAYICFCALMSRLSSNFMLDGIAMTEKFTHLAEALQHYDPEFYDYLKMHQADDLLFCYRWLLLEMKREFAFDDALRMLEVLWSALPAETRTKDLPLYEKLFVIPTVELPPPKSPSMIRTPRETAYTKLCALRRQSSAVSLTGVSPNAVIHVGNATTPKSLDATKRLNHSLDENAMRARRNGVHKAHQSLDETKMLNLLQEVSTENGIAKQDRDDDINQNYQNDININSRPSNRSILSPTLLEAAKNVENINRSRSTSPSAGSPARNNANYNECDSNGDSKMTKPQRTGGHFKELKERLAAAGKKSIFSSIEKFEQNNDLSPFAGQKKVVKNFNEFLNFAAINRDRITDKLSSSNRLLSIGSLDLSDKPLIKFTKSSFEDSDSSKLSIDDGPTQFEVRSQLQLNLSNQLVTNNSSHLIDGSSPDDSQEYFPMTTSMTRELRMELENLDRHVFGNIFDSLQRQHFADQTYGKCDTPESGDSIQSKSPANFSEISYQKLTHYSQDGDDERNREILTGDIEPIVSEEHVNQTELNVTTKRLSTASGNTDIFVWENPLHQCSTSSNEPDDRTNQRTPDEQIDLEYDGEMIDETSAKKSATPIRLVRLNTGSVSESSSLIGRRRKKNQIKRMSYQPDSDSESDDISDSWNDNQQTNHIDRLSHNNIETLHTTNPFTIDDQMIQSIEEATDANNLVSSMSDKILPGDRISTSQIAGQLPPPNEFGGGNPFLIFLCLTLLLQHRNYVMKSAMDYNEMAMHFDKMVRKHNVMRVLNQARRMYANYLRSQKWTDTNGVRPSSGSISGGSNGNNGNSGSLKIDGSNSSSSRSDKNVVINI